MDISYSYSVLYQFRSCAIITIIILGIRCIGTDQHISDVNDQSRFGESTRNTDLQSFTSSSRAADSLCSYQVREGTLMYIDNSCGSNYTLKSPDNCSGSIPQRVELDEEANEHANGTNGMGSAFHFILSIVIRSNATVAEKYFCHYGMQICYMIILYNADKCR